MQERRIDRRRFLGRSLVAGGGVALSSALATGMLGGAVAEAHDRRRHRTSLLDRGKGSGAPLLSGTLLGAHALPRGAEATQRDSTLALEAELGRTLGVFRRYSYWDEPPPDLTHLWAAQGGRIPYISWHAYSRTHTVVPWASIAAGAQDAYILEVGKALASFGYPIFFSFHHEPENDPANGTPAEFAAAFTRVRTVMDAAGATNLTWLCALMGTTYRGRNGGPAAWLPDPGVYAYVGSDGYNRWPLVDKPVWRTFSDVFTGAHQTASTLGKPLFIGEAGCVEQTAGSYPGDPSAKAAWVQGMSDTVRSWGDVVAVCYSHTEAQFRGRAMPYWMDTSTLSLDAFRSVGASSTFTV